MQCECMCVLCSCASKHGRHHVSCLATLQLETGSLAEYEATMVASKAPAILVSVPLLLSPLPQPCPAFLYKGSGDLNLLCYLPSFLNTCAVSTHDPGAIPSGSQWLSVSASKLSLTRHNGKHVSEMPRFRHAKAPKADPLPCHARALAAGIPRPAG